MNIRKEVACTIFGWLPWRSPKRKGWGVPGANTPGSCLDMPEITGISSNTKGSSETDYGSSSGHANLWILYCFELGCQIETVGGTITIALEHLHQKGFSFRLLLSVI